MASYLITGAARGIGFALAKQLVSLPKSDVATIFATSRSQSANLKELTGNYPDRIVFVELEVTKQASIDNAVKLVEEKLNGKGLDVLINNAGVMGTAPGGAPAMQDLESTLDLNVVAPHRVTAAFLPLLRAGKLKKIANITSTLGSIALVRNYTWGSSPAYKVSKAALNMLTAQYAIDLEAEGFTVFVVSPGWLKTDLGGEYADLPVDQGAKAAVDKIMGATSKDNGAFLNILVEGWENGKEGSPNVYDGKNSPW